MRLNISGFLVMHWSFFQTLLLLLLLSFTDWCCANISMYLIGNASFNSLCLGESFCVLFVYYCLSRNKVFEDFTRSSSLKSWKVVWGHIDRLSS